jgi:hypothetical protein
VRSIPLTNDSVTRSDESYDIFLLRFRGLGLLSWHSSGAYFERPLRLYAIIRNGIYLISSRKRLIMLLAAVEDRSTNIQTKKELICQIKRRNVINSHFLLSRKEGHPWDLNLCTQLERVVKGIMKYNVSIERTFKHNPKIGIREIPHDFIWRRFPVAAGVNVVAMICPRIPTVLLSEYLVF